MKYKLEELVNVKIGRTPPRSQQKWFSYLEGMKWVSIKDMGNSGRYVNKTSEKLTDEAVKILNIPIVKKGTVIVSFKLTVGRIAITSEDMVTNEAIAQLNILDDNIVDTMYLYYYLKNYNFDKLGSTSSIATAINSNYLKKMELDIPNLSIQKRIANTLSVIDDKIENNMLINENLAA